jgi:hypothetical protein
MCFLSFLPTYVLKGTLAKENNFFEETGYSVIPYLRNDNISLKICKFSYENRKFSAYVTFSTRSLANFYSVKGGNFEYFSSLIPFGSSYERYLESNGYSILPIARGGMGGGRSMEACSL